MSKPTIRIFPHTQTEFPCADSLQTWLLTSLRARGGIYHLSDKNQVAELAAGSIVLFRYQNELIGEGVVVGYERLDQPIQERALDGEVHEYTAKVKFVPGGIRLFVPPIPVEKIQYAIGGSKANVYPTIGDWTVYRDMIAAHVGADGIFIASDSTQEIRKASTRQDCSFSTNRIPVNAPLLPSLRPALLR